MPALRFTLATGETIDVPLGAIAAAELVGDTATAAGGKTPAVPPGDATAAPDALAEPPPAQVELEPETFTAAGEIEKASRWRWMFGPDTSPWHPTREAAYADGEATHPGAAIG